MAGSHALFSPSSADRVAECPASLLQTKDLPDTPSYDAVEGTVAHFIHEVALTGGILTDLFVGRNPTDFMPPDHLSQDEWALISDLTVTPEMAAYVQDSVDWCRSLPGRHFVEQRLSIDRYTPVPCQFGTSDFVAVDYESKSLAIVDLKFGRGVRVDATENKQLCLYALGALDEFEMFGPIETVSIRVSQPRLDHRDEWVVSVEELQRIGAWLKERFTLALAPDAPFNPTEKACRFCKLRSRCPALYQRTLELSAGMFEDLGQPIAVPTTDGTWPISTPAASSLTAEQIARVIDHADMVEMFLAEVRSNAVHRVLHGQEVPGYKVVEGRTNRRWTDLSQARALLEKHQVSFFKDPEPISPAEAEKHLPKAARPLLAPLVVKPPGRPTLAPVSDKRPAFSAATADGMFADLSVFQPVK